MYLYIVYAFSRTNRPTEHVFETKVYCVYDIMKSYTSVCGVLSIVDICSHIACTRTVSLQYRSKFSLV